MAKHIVFVESNASGIIALQTAKKRGYRVSFICSKLNEHFYKSDSSDEVLSQLDDVVVVENSFDASEIRRAVDSLNKKQHVDGIITVLEYCIQAVAKVAGEYGLKFTSPSGISNVRNKALCRDILKQNGIEDTKYGLAESSNEAKSIAKEIGYPCILKPSGGAASIGASLARFSSDIDKAFVEYNATLAKMDPRLRPIIESPMLVEERLDGRMLSVELGLSDGQFYLFTIDERRRAPNNEVIEVGTMMPAQIPSGKWSEVEKFAKDATQALGLELGIFHIEIMLTKAGPKLIEFNPRLMGGSLPRVYNFIYQDNIYDFLLDIHLGNEVRSTPDHPHCVASSRIFGSAVEKKSASHFNLDWTHEYDQFGLQLNLGIKPGEVAPKLTSNHDYIGALRIRGDSGDASNRLAAEVLERLSSTLDLPLVG